MRSGSLRSAIALLVLLAVSVSVAGCGGAGPTATPTQAPPAAGDPFAGTSEGQAEIKGGVQRLGIDVSKGYYDPTIVRVKAGVPLELSFGQGQGCLARVLFPDFGIDQDLTSGGATVRIPALGAGEYSFSCGMKMVFGKIVAQ